MIGKKLTALGAFGCLYATVYLIGSAIFGAVTEHVADYHLLRFCLFTAIAALIAFVGFTLLRVFDRSLYREYRSCGAARRSFLRTHPGIRTEIAVTLITLCVVALMLALTDKQIVPRPSLITNRVIAAALIVIGFPVYLLLDLCSWRIVCATFDKRS